MTQDIELTILIPCLNESETLASCIHKCKQFIAQGNISAEILVDNGSTDGSQDIARAHGASSDYNTRGYGATFEAVSNKRECLSLWVMPMIVTIF